MKILLTFGTRPEAIKMAPLALELQKYPNHFDVKVCITAQHRQMLDQVMGFFDIKADYDLDLMKPNQNLNSLTADIIVSLKPVLEEFQPDYVLVHGDTTTSMAAAMAAFYSGIKVAHIEAGLRTHNKWSPFPEEMNRAITGRIADLHFAPTINSKNNLIQENITEDKILVTGNTVIDALLIGVEKLQDSIPEDIAFLVPKLNPSRKLILVTGHRRENHGDGFVQICKALKHIAEHHDVDIVYPVHLNPNVKGPVYEILGGISNIHLIEPQGYASFLWLLNQSYLIITDSGGVQEEAPSLGKPVLVMRDTTERPEAVEVGTVILVGTNSEKIIAEAEDLLTNEERYTGMSQLHNPYGDGTACKKIIDFLKNS